MNNGMFVEMCAYVANRDLEKAKFEHERAVSESEKEEILTRDSLKSAKFAGLGLPNVWRFVKGFFRNSTDAVPNRIA